MANSLFHDFLVEYAKFPFPECPIGSSVSSTDLSELDVGCLDGDWKALHAVRDNDLAEKMCEYLKATLGDMPLNEDSQKYLLRSFLPILSMDEEGMRDKDWVNNTSEAKVSVILLPHEFGLSLLDRARGYYTPVCSGR
jgi:hypothetical protein